MANRPRCYREYCCDEATYHIKDGWGYCGLHHNVGYYWAGAPIYRKPEECFDCRKEKTDNENTTRKANMKITFERVKARHYKASTGEEIFYYERNEKGEHAAGWYIGETPLIHKYYHKLSHAKTHLEALYTLGKSG